MVSRPTREVLEGLRLTLQKLEQNFDSVEDEPAMADLKRILLLRIADLEAAEALEAAGREAVETPATCLNLPTKEASNNEP